MLTCFLRGDVLHRFEYGVPTAAFLAKLRGGTCTTGRPDPPDATMHRAKYLLHDNDFADELGREEADLDVKLLGPARYCATSDQLVIECKALLDTRLVFEEMPSKYTTTVHSVHSLQHSILIFLAVLGMPPLPMSVLGSESIASAKLCIQ